jgi:hypothetical protein
LTGEAGCGKDWAESMANRLHKASGAGATGRPADWAEEPPQESIGRGVPRSESVSSVRAGLPLLAPEPRLDYGFVSRTRDLRGIGRPPRTQTCTLLGGTICSRGLDRARSAGLEARSPRGTRPVRVWQCGRGARPSDGRTTRERTFGDLGWESYPSFSLTPIRRV